MIELQLGKFQALLPALRRVYRGQHCAFYAACALIDQCISQGLEPIWSCRKENKGS